VQPFWSAQGNAQLNKLLAHLIECRVDFPGMKIVHIGVLSIVSLLSGDTEPEMSDNVQRIITQNALEMLDRCIQLAPLEQCFATKAVGSETRRIRIQCVGAGACRKEKIPAVHRLLRAADEFSQLHDRPPCGWREVSCNVANRTTGAARWQPVRPVSSQRRCSACPRGNASTPRF